MANHKSAIKRIRQTATRTTRNKTHRSRLRSQVKAFQDATSTGDASEVDKLLGPTISLVDKAVQKGILHRNKANRMKSSITRAAGKVATAQAAEAAS